jgi:hypothetical protein
MVRVRCGEREILPMGESLCAVVCVCSFSWFLLEALPSPFPPPSSFRHHKSINHHRRVGLCRGEKQHDDMLCVPTSLPHSREPLLALLSTIACFRDISDSFLLLHATTTPPPISLLLPSSHVTSYSHFPLSTYI